MGAARIRLPPTPALAALAGAALALLAGSMPALAGDDGLVFRDPARDDRGPGKYVYPTDPVYTRGSFDIQEVQVLPKGDDVVFRVKVGARVEDPWKSRDWGGNGFSLQMVFVFLDTDHKEGSGHTRSIPGLNLRFDPREAWDRVVILSPQGRSRLQAEVEQKAGAMRDAVVIPRVTRAEGKVIEAVVAARDLGGPPGPTWGYQVVMQSNEGYPDKGDLLTRKVNEYEGPHRFGGGSDFDCDPHAIDILMPPAEGKDAEQEAQFRTLGAYTCDGAGNGVQAVVPMIYPGK